LIRESYKQNSVLEWIKPKQDEPYPGNSEFLRSQKEAYENSKT
jgi:hypothetical protein